MEWRRIWMIRREVRGMVKKKVRRMIKRREIGERPVLNRCLNLAKHLKV